MDRLVEAGVDAIQVRAKGIPDRDLLRLVTEILEAVNGRAKVIVNDRLDIALAAGADGVHLGLDDLPVAAARRLAPQGFVVGGTCRNVEHAVRAKESGADYVGVGPVYASTSKNGLPDPIGLAMLEQVAEVLPAIAISGITLERVPEVMAHGAHGIAVIAAITRAEDPAKAAGEIADAVARHRRSVVPPKEPTLIGR